MSPSSNYFEACPDTGSPISLISQKCLEDHFPDVVRTEAQRGVQLAGIGQGPTTFTFVKILVRLPTTTKTVVDLEVEAYVIDKLDVNLLLGNAFLCANHLDVIWAKIQNGLDFLQYQDFKIPISVKLKTNKRSHRAQIYAIESVTVYLGTGINVRIRHRPL